MNSDQPELTPTTTAATVTLEDLCQPGRRAGLCEIWPWKCPNAATLIVYGEPPCQCRPCMHYDEECQGHAVCDEHGAALRIRVHNQLPRSGTGPPFIVARIHSLPAWEKVPSA